MVSLAVTLPQLQLFLLVFLRTGAFLMSIPMLNGPSVPVIFRIGLALVTSLLMLPAVTARPAGRWQPMSFTLAVAAAGEVLIGSWPGSPSA